jgi:hypothetical protein
VRRVLLLALVAAAALGFTPQSAHATNECDGLMVCVPVHGPWVVLPLAAKERPARVQYQLSCPRNYVVGGLDAELSVRAIDLSFLGRLGSPVNPGISTSRAVVFVGTYVGATARAASFRPHIGCMPATGGGGRVRTAAGVAKVFPPGQPATLRVKSARIRPGSAVVAHTCRARERLVTASHALAFYTADPPTGSLIGSVSARERRAGKRLAVSVRGDAELGGVRAVVQVQLLCSEAR